MTPNEPNVKIDKYINEVDKMPLDVTGSLRRGSGKRSSKYYFKNEKEVMRRLGLEPVPGSGSGWIHKEDGESDLILAQLKSTDHDSYRIQQLDLDKLEYHASVANKVPVFIVQFLRTNKLYLMVEAENIEEFFNAFVKEVKPKQVLSIAEEDKVEKATIRSSSKARNSFFKEREERWQRRQK